jgi:hypothetical protein
LGRFVVTYQFMRAGPKKRDKVQPKFALLTIAGLIVLVVVTALTTVAVHERVMALTPPGNVPEVADSPR